MGNWRMERQIELFWMPELVVAESAANVSNGRRAVIK